MATTTTTTDQILHAMTKEVFHRLWMSPEEVDVVRFEQKTELTGSNIIAFTVRVKPTVVYVCPPASARVFITAVDFQTREITGGIVLLPK